MLCDECGVNNATVEFVSIINGKKIERHLCPACAHKLGADSFMPFSWGDVFPTVGSFSPRQEARCSVCGSTLADIARTGLIGCAQCYHDLREGILPIVSRVQTKTRHTGRAPATFESKKIPETASKPESETEEARLTRELNDAVAKEEYERAAALRDQLKALRGELPNSQNNPTDNKEGN